MQANVSVAIFLVNPTVTSLLVKVPAVEIDTGRPTEIAFATSADGVTRNGWSDSSRNNSSLDDDGLQATH